MSESFTDYEAIIIGGGFYGTAIAIYLAKQRGLKRIVIIERESRILTRASYNNQARVHNGYHYPRSFTTAYRSRVNLPRFVEDWGEAVVKNFTKIYAIARRNSKVTAKQFERFSREIGATIKPADETISSLFRSSLIEETFLVQEYAFDSTKLANWAIQELDECGIEILFDTSVVGISKSSKNTLDVECVSCDGSKNIISTSYVFNCTYSGLNQFGGSFAGTNTKLKHEITEMGLIKMPSILNKMGITVMDGPFFSFMPFPARCLHTLSHVRYTPHMSWNDQQGVNPYLKLDAYHKESRVDKMVRDVGRYIPSIVDAQHKDSLFEVKTVLVKNEGDDGRPILFEKHSELPGCYSVLGGKIDNIYDVLETLNEEAF